MRSIGDGGRRQIADGTRVATQVFYADGEKKSTAVIQAVLHHLGARVTHFGEGEACLAALETHRCHLLISNARRPAVEGLELLLGAKDIVPSVPAVMMVDHGDIQTAVRAMRSGAIDCLERPPEQKHLLSALEAALQASVRNATPEGASLSPAERQVLHLILQGQTTAETARTLHRSRRTIEVHRGHIMRKLQVDGMVDLVRKCAQLGYLEDWP
jgi:two-component system response regulator FixJ